MFGNHLPVVPVSSTKSMIGHCVTAGGAIEMAAVLAGFAGGEVPPTAGFSGADPECDVDVVPEPHRPMDAEYALSNAFAFGGLNASVAVRRV